MGKFWSILFLLVPILGVWIFVAAIANLWPFCEGPYAFGNDFWFPEDISRDGFVIDGLFNFIMYLTGAIFIGTGLAMFYFLWKYDAESNRDGVRFMHGSHTLEVVWSILPAATLLFIAIYQMDTWAGNKVTRPNLLPGLDGIVGTADDTAEIQVTGRQFEWRIQYAGADKVLGTPDDLYTVNDLHLPVDEEAVLAIKSMDVLHSLFLPNVRLKHDLVPGMKQYVWFTPTKEGTYDIVCAELCGWGHYKMKGRMTIESRTEYEAWLKQLEEEQNLAEFVAQAE